MRQLTDKFLFIHIVFSTMFQPFIISDPQGTVFPRSRKVSAAPLLLTAASVFPYLCFVIAFSAYRIAYIYNSGNVFIVKRQER
jgi:hypothetical protein